MAPWVGVGWNCLLVGREWDNFMALAIYEAKVTLCLFIFVSCPLRVCSGFMVVYVQNQFLFPVIPVILLSNNYRLLCGNGDDLLVTQRKSG